MTIESYRGGSFACDQLIKTYSRNHVNTGRSNKKGIRVCQQLMLV